jgi:hypothetical protein
MTHAHANTRARARTHTHTHAQRERERERERDTHTHTYTHTHTIASLCCGGETREELVRVSRWGIGWAPLRGTRAPCGPLVWIPPRSARPRGRRTFRHTVSKVLLLVVVL